MRKTSVRELHIHTSKYVQEAADGGVIVIERRGEPVAELRPLARQDGLADIAKARLFDSMEEIWGRMPLAGDSTELIEDDRDR